MPTADHTPRVAYLTGEYPAVSHTFILREVEALRGCGLEVETCAIRKTGQEHQRGPAEKEAARSTFYVLAAARDPRALLGAQKTALTAPGRYFGALALAWQTSAPGWRALLYQFFYFVEATVLAAHLKHRDITHLHNHFAAASATVAMLAARIAGVPFSFTLHGPADLQEPARWRLDAKIAQAKFVACISYFARSQAMLHSTPTHWNKLRIIHCGVIPALYTNPPATPTYAGTQLIFVGRLAAVKGVRILLDALAQARQSYSDLSLTLVGDGPDRAALEAAAAPLGSAVRFTGYQSQSEVANLLAQSDALVLPSFAEGVPVVLMEAMASGKPVIATRVAGVAELVEDGVSGYLVAPGDTDGLAQTIIRLYNEVGKAPDMGVSGQRKVQAEFDIEKEAARLATLFRGTAHGTPRPSL